MKRFYLATIIVIGIFTASASAQQPKQSATPPPTPTPDEDIVRIPVTLVQVDAVVKDKNGRQVADLKPEDFEILEDGRPQEITNFSYVPAPSKADRLKPERDAKVDRNAPLAPPATTRLRPEQVRRTIVFVIDDMSYDSFSDTKKALKKFVEKQMQPGDLVAIVPMGEVVRAFQPFTTDKRLLLIAIDRMRWVPSVLYGVNAIPDEKGVTPTEDKAAGEDTTADAEEQRFYEGNRLHGKLASLSLIVRGTEALPGRKTMFLFSDYFLLFGILWDGYDNNRAKEELRIVSGQANRALVTINTVDVRGIPVLSVTAADNFDQTNVLGRGSMKPSTAHQNPNVYGSVAGRRLRAFLKAQEGMKELAERTGGHFTQSNDPAADVADALDDDKGYYLIAYTLDEKSADFKTAGRSFHKIEVRMKRPGLQVRTRKEFYGVPRNETTLQNRGTPIQKLFAALDSPYHQGEVGLRLTPLFGHDVKDGSFVRSLLHVAGSNLTFTPEADGYQQAVIRVIAVAYDSNGIVGEPLTQNFTLRARGDGIERIKRDGVIYEMTLPVKRAGVYQVRAAVQDAASERIGAANQFLEVPDISAGRLALSGLLVSGKDLSKKVGEKQQAANVELKATAAVRILRRGMQLSYAFIVYSPQLGKETRQPQLETQLAVYRDGQPVYKTPLELPAPSGGGGGSQSANLKQIIMKGNFALGAEFTPGEYVLQVVVTDKLAKEKYRTATRWIEFDVVE